MALTYPIAIDTPWKKVQYILRLKEYLRMIHNFAGYWYRNGLTQDEYDNGIDAGELSGMAGTTIVLTSQLKAKYSYHASITKTQLGNFINTEWEPRHSVVNLEIQDKIKNLKNQTEFDHLLDLNF